MARRVILAILLLATVAGCGRFRESRLNPFNWFGRDQAVDTLTPEVGVARDGRPLVDQVLSIEIDRTAGGAILRAVGLPPIQGHWDADLVLDAERTGDGVLAYQFRLRPPFGATRVSTQASREVVVATFLSDQRLTGVREVQVLGARSARSVRR